MYDVDYFIAKFESIPDAMWTRNTYGTKDGPKCAMGHCRDWSHVSEYGLIAGINSDESWQLDRLFFTKYGRGNVEDVNDRKSEAFPQETPKQRILAALRSFR